MLDPYSDNVQHVPLFKSFPDKDLLYPVKHVLLLICTVSLTNRCKNMTRIQWTPGIEIESD